MKEDAGGPLWVKAAHVPVHGIRDVPYRDIVVSGWDVDVGHTNFGAERPTQKVDRVEERTVM